MRAADATEKISRDRAALLQPYKTSLIGLRAEATQPEVRWHLALIVPRLQLTFSECRGVADILQLYLKDRSSIVKTFAMQGLSDLTRQDASLRPWSWICSVHSRDLELQPCARGAAFCSGNSNLCRNV
jgi:hypothetical protein